MGAKATISVYKKLVAEKIKNKYKESNAVVVRDNLKMLDSSAEKANKLSDSTGVYYVKSGKSSK